MAKYVKRNGQWVHISTGERMTTDEQRKGPIPCPTVRSDIQAYQSPVDGRWISSMSERRDDLKRNGCIDARELPSPTGGKLKNKAFCEKRGLQVSEEYR